MRRNTEIFLADQMGAVNSTHCYVRGGWYPEPWDTNRRLSQVRDTELFICTAVKNRDVTLHVYNVHHRACTSYNITPGQVSHSTLSRVQDHFVRLHHKQVWLRAGLQAQRHTAFLCKHHRVIVAIWSPFYQNFTFPTWGNNTLDQ